MTLPVPLDVLTDDEADALARIAQKVSYKTDACIFKEGTDGDRFYIVDEGQVRIELERPEIDSDSVLGYVGDNQIMGELSLLDRKPRSASGYAHTDVTVREISTDKLTELLEARPRLYAKIMATLGHSAALKLRRTNEMLAAAIFEETDPEVDEMVMRAAAAQQQIQDWSEERDRCNACRDGRGDRRPGR